MTFVQTLDYACLIDCRLNFLVNYLRRTTKLHAYHMSINTLRKDLALFSYIDNAMVRYLSVLNIPVDLSQVQGHADLT